jgi:hypothetical protein
MRSTKPVGIDSIAKCPVGSSLTPPAAYSQAVGNRSQRITGRPVSAPDEHSRQISALADTRIILWVGAKGVKTAPPEHVLDPLNPDAGFESADAAVRLDREGRNLQPSPTAFTVA